MTVKCLYCGKLFDPETTEYEKPRVNRYAHKSCCTDDNENWVRDKIKIYVKEKLGLTYNAARVNTQLKQFTEKNNYSLIGIYNALKYWYEVLGRGQDVSKAGGGIGIVPSIYEEGNAYFAEKQKSLDKMKQYDIRDYVNNSDEKIVVEWEPPVRPKNYKIIDLR